MLRPEKCSHTYVAFFMLHFLLFSLSLAVLAIYAEDMAQPDLEGHPKSKWIFVQTVAGLSALTALLRLLPSLSPPVRPTLLAASALWSVTLFLLWIAVFGVFAHLFIDPRRSTAQPINETELALEGASGSQARIERMQSVVYVDLVCAALWGIDTIAGCAWWRNRQRAMGIKEVHGGVVV